MVLQFVLSQKNTPLLSFHGFLFSKCSETTNKITWRCVRYVTDKCRGRAHTSSQNPDGDILWESPPEEHTHAPRQELVEVKKRLADMKNRARRSNENTSKIVTDAIATASSVVAAELPQSEYLARTVQRIRQQANPQLPDPLHRKDLVLPESFQKTLKGENFLLHDTGGIKRILIFATKENLATLGSCDVWCCDGTFKTVPKIYTQLYTIHGYKAGKVMPLVYAIMPDKKERSYTEILTILKTSEPSLNPKHILIDYEKSFMSSCLTVFPAVQLDGCFFHFGQCVWRRIQEKKLSVHYGDDVDFALRVRMLIALAFVPVEYVIEAFEKLVKSKFFTADENIIEIIEYFDRTWIGQIDRRGRRIDPLFPLEMWNCYQAVINQLPRTNNSAEAWHRGFTSPAHNRHAT